MPKQKRTTGKGTKASFVVGTAGSVRNAALIIAAKNLADGVAGSGITVNTVSPGTVTASPAAEDIHKLVCAS